MNSPDVERQELDRAIELLGRSTRPACLLRYLGEKYFQRPEEQLSEVDIATDVFGRSAKTFDAAQDAIVRVEVHRLRKKLRQIYEKRGESHGLQISLPAGSYLLQFSPAPVLHHDDKAVEQEAPFSESVAGSSEAGIAGNAAAPRPNRNRVLYYFFAGVLCAILFAAIWLSGPRDAQTTSPSQAERPAQSNVAASAKNSEVHIMAGYSGGDVTDDSGVRWTSDRLFTGGAPWPSTGRIVRRTSRQFLFANWRNGEFTYDVPVQPGTYELRLLFVSPMRVGDEKLFGFNVSLNGKPLLTAYDVTMDAQGADIADEKVFRDVEPDKNGFIRIRFSNQLGMPWLNALEIVPGTPRKQRPIRITTQPTSFVDHKGQRWSADDYFLNGFPSIEHRVVSGTEDPELFRAERYGHFSYSIPVDTRGRYTLVLHFAEFYFGPQLPGGGGVGSRVFHVFGNGQTLLENFDVYKEGDSLRLVTKTFSNIKPSAQGKINLTFEPVVNNATVSGIEILDESD